MIEQLEKTSARDALGLPQHEIDRQAQDIFEMNGINATLAYEDLQEDVATQLRSRRDELLSGFMENPLASFKREFTELARLYEGRSHDFGTNGTTSVEFVTRNTEKNKADLHFREVTFADGTVTQKVEVPRRDTGGESFFISVTGDEMTIERTHYVNGYTRFKAVDQDSQLGQQFLKEYFTHSNKASGLVFNRSAEELEQADEQARQFLKYKHYGI